MLILLSLDWYVCYTESYLIYKDSLYINSGIRTWGVCPCSNNSPEWEASSINVEAGLALLAYMGVEI